MKRRIFVTVLVIVMVIGAIPITAAAGSGAQGMVSAANSYLENATGPDFGGGSENWCGRFLYRCAEDAGETAALCGSVDTMKSTNSAMAWFIRNGCEGGYFYNTINYKNYGMTTSNYKDKSTYTPAVGDIIFYDWDGNPTNFGHMELLTGINGRKITTVGGSTGSSCTQKNWKGQLHVHAHTYDISNKFIVGYVRPNYGGSTIPSDNTGSNQPLTQTKTQYRYHRYIDAAGNVSLCPYYGGALFNSKMTIQYTDWLDSPLTKNSNPSGHFHQNQSASCTNNGCIDKTGNTERFTDGSSNWYYEETRVVEIVQPSTEPIIEPTPEITPEPVQQPDCSNGHSYRVDGETDTVIYYVCSVCGDSYEELKSKLPFASIYRYNEGMFSDVHYMSWYSENVATVYRMGLMKGTGSGVFSPDDTITLAETVTLAARIHRIYNSGSDEFETYDGGNWYDPYVEYARENRIIDTHYNYNRPATREEFVSILAKALPRAELNARTGWIAFADWGEITYTADVDLLVEAGVINGETRSGQNYFRPLDTITRAEAAAVVARLVNPDARL